MKKAGRDLLFPLLRVFAPMLVLRADLSVEDLPRPVDSPSVIASGSDPDRVLLIGSGPTMGYGVLSHELALPGHLARQISAYTSRGVTVDVVPVGEITMQSTISHLEGINLARYDAVVLTVGINDVFRLTSREYWRREVRALAEYLSERLPTHAQAFFVAVQPLRSIRTFSNVLGTALELQRQSLNREAARVCAEFPLLTFVPFNPRGEFFERHRSNHIYATWAALMLPPIVTVLLTAPGVEVAASPEESRQRALDELGILDTEPEERFDRITEFARKLFATQSSAISFLDHDREWIKTGTAFDRSETPHKALLIEQVIQQSGVFVVEDARDDERYSTSQFVIGPPFLRFYAGHPIESRNGERVGVISVFDQRPRQFTDVDARLLRDLAFLVQRELTADDT